MNLTPAGLIVLVVLVGLSFALGRAARDSAALGRAFARLRFSWLGRARRK